MALVQGECVSCGRGVGRFVGECPYCGERVWQQPWFRVLRIGLVAGVAVVCVGLVLRVPVRLRELWPGSCWGGFLLAVALVFALIPCSEKGLIMPTWRQRIVWQVQGVGGAVLMLVSGCVAAGVIASSGSSSWLGVSGAVALLLTAPWLPLFWPVSRRGWAVLLLGFAALLLRLWQ